MPVEADLGMAGTPCHPFSVQAAGRFAAGTVEDHPEYGVAMSSFLDWLQVFEPRCTVFEQVPGFKMPIYKGASESPYGRCLVPNCPAHVMHCPLYSSSNSTRIVNSSIVVT